MLTTGVDTIVGTAGNDAINATNTGTSTVLGGLDTVDGGTGTDTLNVADTATAAGAYFALPAGFAIKNVEVLNVTTNGAIAGGAGVNFDMSGVVGLTNANLVAAGTANSQVKAAATTDVALTVAGAATATVNGGKAVTVNGGTGATAVTGAALTSVTVNKGGAVTIDNTDSVGTTSVGTTLTSVTLNSVDANSAVKGAALTAVSVGGATTAARTVTVTNGTAAHTLTVNATGTGYDALGTTEYQTVVTDAAATKAIVNTTAKSSLDLSGSTLVTGLTLTGSGALKLAPMGAATLSIDGSAASGNLSLGSLNAAAVTVKTGSGNDSFTLNATTKVTVDTGAGNDALTLGSAVAIGSTINLGAGNDKLLVAGGSVTPSSATVVTVVDGGDGVDSIAAALINAANAAQFKNFESIDMSSTATLDVELMTGSAITGLTISGGAGGATLTNVAAGAGLTVTGSNAGISTIGVKGAATGTADTFVVTFADTAAAGATAAAPTSIAAGTVVLNGVETVAVASGGSGFVANSITITDDKLKTLNLSGDKDLTVAFTGTNGTNTASGGAVTLIDGSSATGKLSINTANVTANSAAAGLTVKGGSAADTISLAQKATVDAGGGNDTIVSAATGGTFGGGAGTDKFDVSAAVATAATEVGSVFTTITDIGSGEGIKLLGTAAAFTSTKVALDATVTTLDAALALAGGTANQVTWFQYGANTYVLSNDADVAFDAGDVVVKLTGLIDLSGATLNTTTDYLTLA